MRPASSCPSRTGTRSASGSCCSRPRRRRPIRASSIAIDLALPASDVDYGLYRELAGLAPTGPGNPDPLVAVLGLTVTRVRAATGGHSQLTLRRERDVLDGIAFGRADIAEVVHEGDRLDVVARLTSRRFGGFESLQLDIRDVATSGSHPRSAALLDAAADRRQRPGPRRERLVTPSRDTRSAPGRSRCGSRHRALAGAGAGDRRAPGRRPHHPRPSAGWGPVRRHEEQSAAAAAGTAGRPDSRPPRRRTWSSCHADVVSVPGTFVYAKAGNIWLQTGKQAHQLTTGGNDSMPSFSPDGKTVYFVRTVNGIGHWPSSGIVRDYQMTIPNVMKVATDGSSDPVQVVSGKVSKNGWSWQSWIREPVLSPDGETLAMVSDRPDPSRSDVVAAVLRHDDQEVDRPEADRGVAARPPGSRMAARRQGPAVRPATGVTARAAHRRSTAGTRSRARRPR